MGIDWEKAWAEFQGDLDRLAGGEKRYLDWDDAGAGDDGQPGAAPSHGNDT
jgi:hypothetical protein